MKENWREGGGWKEELRKRQFTCGDLNTRGLKILGVTRCATLPLPELLQIFVLHSTSCYNTRNMQWNPTLHSSLSNKIILSCMWEMISATTNTYSSSSPLLSWSLSFTLSHSFWIKERHKEERKNWNFMFSSCLLVLSGGHYMISVTKGNVVGWSFPARPGSSKVVAIWN